MKKWTFEVEVWEGNDEFWESNPSHDEVREVLIDQLMGVSCGWLDGTVKLTGHSDEIKFPESKRILQENGSPASLKTVTA